MNCVARFIVDSTSVRAGGPAPWASASEDQTPSTAIRRMRDISKPLDSGYDTGSIRDSRRAVDAMCGANDSVPSAAAAIHSHGPHLRVVALLVAGRYLERGRRDGLFGPALQ